MNRLPCTTLLGLLGLLLDIPPQMTSTETSALPTHPQTHRVQGKLGRPLWIQVLLHSYAYVLSIIAVIPSSQGGDICRKLLTLTFCIFLRASAVFRRLWISMASCRPHCSHILLQEALYQWKVLIQQYCALLSPEVAKQYPRKIG